MPLVHKTTISTVIAMVGMLPLVSYAWHGDYGPHRDGGWFNHCEVQTSHHVQGHRIQRHPFNPVVRTFGMDEKAAKNYVADIKKVINISNKQDPAWNAFAQSFVALANARYEHRGTHKDFRQMTRQEFLEYRSHWMTQQAKAFEGFVKARAQLEKVLKPEQMQRFDFIVATGHLVE